MLSHFDALNAGATNFEEKSFNLKRPLGQLRSLLIDMNGYDALRTPLSIIGVSLFDPAGATTVNTWNKNRDK